MARYMSNWGEQREFEAKNSDEIICNLKKVFKWEGESDPVFVKGLASDATRWCGSKLTTNCNRSFVKSMSDANLLLCLSNQSKQQDTDLLIKWAEASSANLHFNGSTIRQLKFYAQMGQRFNEFADNLNDSLVDEILKCKLEGAHYQKRYDLLPAQSNAGPLGLLNFVLNMIKAEVHENHEASAMFDSVYTQFPDALFDFTVMWQFTLNLPMGKEFLRSALNYLADLVKEHPYQRHDLISNYLPKQPVPTEAKLYFAYGSNMDHAQMLNRCSSAEFVGLASLKNFEYYIDARGVASLKPKYGATAWGVLWDIQDPSDWAALDGYEGVSSKRYKRLTTKVHFSDRDQTCQVYISGTPNKGTPRCGYQENIVAAVLFHQEWFEKERTKMGNETFLERGGYDCEYPFKLWHNEMISWLGAENG